MKIFNYTINTLLALLFSIGAMASTPDGNDFKIIVTGGEHFSEGARVAIYRQKVEDSPERVEFLIVEAFKNNRFEYTGNVDDPHIVAIDILPADDDHPYHRITMALEPGITKINFTGQKEFKLEGGRLNNLLVNSWNENEAYLKAVKEYRSFSNKKPDFKNSEVRKEFSERNRAINSSKQKALVTAFNSTREPFEQLLIYAVGYRGADNWEKSQDLKEKLALQLSDKRDAKIMLKGIKSSRESKLAQSKIGIGSVIKDFEAQDLSGKTFHLADVLKKNKYVLVEFWASWCGPCRGEIPHMKNAYKNFNNKGFEIVSFTLDHKKERWEKASEEEQIPWINTGDLLAYTSPVVKLYGVAGVPANYLVEAATGKIIATNLRGEKLDHKLEKLLNK